MTKSTMTLLAAVRGLRCHWRPTAAFTTVLLAGCQSGTFRAAHLPPEFRVAASSESQAIEMARVAAPGASHAMIAPSDLLEISLATGRDNEKITPVLARVADDGTVDVPVVGPVPVAGMEAFDASRNIARLAIERGMYRHPMVTVEIEKKAVHRITVLGAVKEPGSYEIPRGGSDLVSALAAAGGLTDEAGTEVEIVRQPTYGLAANGVPPVNDALADEAKSGEIELAAYQNIGHHRSNPTQAPPSSGWSAAQTIRLDLASGKPMHRADFRLHDRDVVRVVPRKKAMIHVSGLVNKPGQFELPKEQEIHLLDAIAMAGGRSSPVADKVFVIRHVENRPEPLVIQASIAKAKQTGLENLRLTAGDTITVEQTPITAVVDTLSKFFRLSFGIASNTVF